MKKNPGGQISYPANCLQKKKGGDCRVKRKGTWGSVPGPLAQKLSASGGRAKEKDTAFGEKHAKGNHRERLCGEEKNTG